MQEPRRKIIQVVADRSVIITHEQNKHHLSSCNGCEKISYYCMKVISLIQGQYEDNRIFWDAFIAEYVVHYLYEEWVTERGSRVSTEDI